MPTETKRDPVRGASNRLFLKISGRRLRAYSIVKHVGRRSGREYVNPVSAYPLGDGFVITILYGLDSQWVRNVLATGRLTLMTQGREHALERPELIPTTQALPEGTHSRRERCAGDRPLITRSGAMSALPHAAKVAKRRSSATVEGWARGR